MINRNNKFVNYVKGEKFYEKNNRACNHIRKIRRAAVVGRLKLGRVRPLEG